MPVVAADLLIGSYPNLEAQSLSVTASSVTEPVAIAAGSYYLYDTLGTQRGLTERMMNALLSHSVLSDVVLYLTEQLYIRIVSSTAFTLTWPSDGILRDLLGFTGSLSPAAAVHTATRRSPLLWTAGKPTTWEARVGTDGILVRDIAVGQSGPSTMRATSFNRYRRNTLSYRYVANARMWTTAEAGGEFFTFFDQVLAERRRFKVWRNCPVDFAGVDVLESDGLGSNDRRPSSGAYVYSGNNEMPWGREYGFVDALHPISIPVVTTREYDAA